MGTRYRQLGIEERCEIARLCAAGRSIRQIASALDRQPSTIAREIRRNQSHQTGYQAVYAERQSRARRWSGSKLDRDADLREVVLSRLAHGWSPEQVSGRLAKEAGKPIISHETIYRFVYAQIRRTQDYSWRRYLPLGKSKRGWRGRKGGSPTSFIALRCPISERPRSADDRQMPGHWEADLMQFRNNTQTILAVHERSSRLVIAVRPPGKAAELIARALCAILTPLPPAWRQTVTFDNGTEFAQHYDLHVHDIETYFCNTRSPWQKGGIENAIGRMRRCLPRKTDLASMPDHRFIAMIQTYNNTPRKCLDFLTPAEFFWEKLLHFKCESTPRPSSG